MTNENKKSIHDVVRGLEELKNTLGDIMSEEKEELATLADESDTEDAYILQTNVQLIDWAMRNMSIAQSDLESIMG